MPIDTTHATIIAALIFGAISLLIIGIRTFQSSIPADIKQDWRTILDFRYSEMEEHLRTLPSIPEQGETPSTLEERQEIKEIVGGVSAKVRAYNKAYDLLADLESARNSLGVGLIAVGLMLAAAAGLTLVAIQFDRSDLILLIWLLTLTYLVSLWPKFKDGIRKNRIESAISAEATKSMGLERVEI